MYKCKVKTVSTSRKILCLFTLLLWPRLWPVKFLVWIPMFNITANQINECTNLGADYLLCVTTSWKLYMQNHRIKIGLKTWHSTTETNTLAEKKNSKAWKYSAHLGTLGPLSANVKIQLIARNTRLYESRNSKDRLGLWGVSAALAVL